MGKGKKSRCVKLGDHNTSTIPIESPDSDPDLDLQGESSWVIVKKQRVVILVPSLPVDDISRRPVAAMSLSRLNPESRNSEVKRVDDGTEFPLEDDQRENPMLVDPRNTLCVAQTKPSEQYPKWVHVTESYKPHRAAKISRMIVRPKLALVGQSRFGGGGCVPLNQRLRALNLERKLRRAGGLSRWLSSLGLGQFERLFQRKGLGKFHLVNLTMKSLKDMGASAVGPRRKLIHAIDCICQPHCFMALR